MEIADDGRTVHLVAGQYSLTQLYECIGEMKRKINILHRSRARDLIQEAEKNGHELFSCTGCYQILGYIDSHGEKEYFKETMCNCGDYR